MSSCWLGYFAKKGAVDIAYLSCIFTRHDLAMHVLVMSRALMKTYY